MLQTAPRRQQADRTSRLDRDAQDLHLALEEFLRIYQFRDRDRICCHDLSVTQCYALGSLVKHGQLSMNDLAAQLYLDKSTTSRVVDALERKGYAKRSPDPEDRRALRLEATRRGRDLHRRIEQAVIGQEKQLIADFSPEVRNGMVQLINRLARAASQCVDASGGTCCTTS